MAFLKVLAMVSFIAAPVARATPAEECNEKIRLHIIEKARSKCKGRYHDLLWSEREVDVSEDGKMISGAFHFRCESGRRFLALTKVITATCEIARTEISHTSLTPDKP